jgi:hypothetical protein
MQRKRLQLCKKGIINLNPGISLNVKASAMNALE